MAKIPNFISAITIAAFFIFFPNFLTFLKGKWYSPDTWLRMLILIIVIIRIIARWLWYRKKVTEWNDTTTIKTLSHLYLLYYVLHTIASISILIWAVAIVCWPMFSIQWYAPIFIVCVVWAVFAIPAKIKINKKIQEIENTKIPNSL